MDIIKKMVKIIFDVDKSNLKFFAVLLVVLSAGFAFSALQAEVPDPGHPVSEIQKCGEGETLVVINDQWDCVSNTITCADLPGGSCAVDNRIGAVSSGDPNDGDWCRRDVNGQITCTFDAPTGTGGDGAGCTIQDTSGGVMITCGGDSYEVLDGQDGVDGSDGTGGGGPETDPTVKADVKDGVSWGEISGIPSDIADGDDVGGTSGPATDVVCTSCISASDIATNGVGSAEIVQNSITQWDLASNSVYEDELAAGVCVEGLRIETSNSGWPSCSSGYVSQDTWSFYILGTTFYHRLCANFNE